MRFNASDGIEYEGRRGVVVAVEELSHGRQVLRVVLDDDPDTEVQVYNTELGLRG